MSFRDRDKAVKESAEWLIKLDSETVSELDRLRHAEWLEQNKDNKKEFVAMLSSYARVKKTTEEFESSSAEISDEFARLLEDTVIKQSKPPRKAWLALAAAVSLLAGLLLSYFLVEGGFYSHKTGSAEQQVVHLSDGSKIRLNAKSAISVDYSEDVRGIKMSSGEAYFDVAKDHDRPFVVTVDGYSVRAVGTAFNVHSRNKTIEVVVTEGAVSFTGQKEQHNSSVLVTELQGVSVAPSLATKIETYSPNEVDNITAWTEGRLVFSQEKLSDIIAEVNYHTPGIIVIVDKELNDIVSGGVFDIGDAASLLKALELALPVKTTKITPYLTLLSKE